MTVCVKVPRKKGRGGEGKREKVMGINSQISNGHDAPIYSSRDYEVVWIMDAIHFGDSKAARSKWKIDFRNQNRFDSNSATSKPVNLVKISLGVPHKIIPVCHDMCKHVFVTRSHNCLPNIKIWPMIIILSGWRYLKESNRNFCVTNTLKFKLEPQFWVLLQPHYFHVLFSVLLLPTGLTVGAKHLPN